MRQYPRRSMCRSKHAVQLKNAIAERMPSTRCPQPTIAGHIYMPPKEGISRGCVGAPSSTRTRATTELTSSGIAQTRLSNRVTTAALGTHEHGTIRAHHNLQLWCQASGDCTRAGATFIAIYYSTKVHFIAFQCHKPRRHPRASASAFPLLFGSYLPLHKATPRDVQVIPIDVLRQRLPG